MNAFQSPVDPILLKWVLVILGGIAVVAIVAGIVCGVREQVAACWRWLTRKRSPQSAETTVSDAAAPTGKLHVAECFLCHRTAEGCTYMFWTAERAGSSISVWQGAITYSYNNLRRFCAIVNETIQDQCLLNLRRMGSRRLDPPNAAVELRTVI